MSTKLAFAGPLPLETEPDISPGSLRQAPYPNRNSILFDRLTLLSFYLYTQH